MADLDNYCRAAEIYGLGTMIKVDQDPRLSGAALYRLRLRKRALCRLPQRRGSARVRAHGAPGHARRPGLWRDPRRFAYSGDGKAEYVQALRDVVVAIMIEKYSAVEQLEEILSVPGVDAIQWGPSDYTMSSGAYRPGRHRH